MLAECEFEEKSPLILKLTVNRWWRSWLFARWLKALHDVGLGNIRRQWGLPNDKKLGRLYAIGMCVTHLPKTLLDLDLKRVV